METETRSLLKSNTCTIGDQSYGEAEATVTPNHGHIFKPGQHPVDNANAMARPKVQYFTGHRTTNTFRIVSARPPVILETVNKVGRTTGWTQGIIKPATMKLMRLTKDPTCPGGFVGNSAKTRDTDSTFSECLSYTSFAALSGDSGSPVFALDPPNSTNAILVGVLFGQTETKGVFIPIDRIYAETLKAGYDWNPSFQQFRPIPAPMSLTQETTPRPRR